MNKRILYTKPSVTSLEIDYATDAAATGWGSKCYDYINRFEKEFAEYLGVKHAIATSSCTGALHMGLAALGIGPGDEVILADTNWIATAAPIVHLGAEPIFVDILADSWCLNPIEVEKAITTKTKAIIAVHIYGNLCDMNSLLDIGRKYSLPIIEDAAEAIGSEYHGDKAGSMGEFSTFSFHGTKTITTGEGGMFVTNNSVLYEKVKTLSNHGRSEYQKKQFWPDMVGFKYKMSNIQAALGCAQLERVDELVAKKREILAFYKKNLGEIKGVSMNPEPENIINGAWMPTIVFDRSLGIRREKLQEVFIKQNIDARVFFWPLSCLDMFTNADNPISYDIPERAINLPSYQDLTIDDLNHVIQTIMDIL